jgi:hypothetical protein
MKPQSQRRNQEQPASDDGTEIASRGLVIGDARCFVAKEFADELRAALDRDEGGQQIKNARDRHPLPNLGQVFLVHVPSVVSGVARRHLAEE